MDALNIGLLALVAVAATVNWSTRRPGTAHLSPWIEWLSKPTVTLGLIVLAAVIEPVDETQRWWFVAGLVLCLVGDIALMLPTERFRTGLGAFLLGHLAFVVGFILRGQSAPRLAVVVSAAVLLLCLVVAARHLLPGVRRSEPGLLGPVVAYVIVIASMALSSWWGGHWAAPIGAATFAVSDLTLADNKFISARRWSPLVVMVSYHLALALLVLSLR